MTLTTFLPRESTLAAARRWVFPTLVALAAVAIVVRVVAFFVLPNVDGDAYCYLEKARELRAAILAFTLRPSDLFFFWLPLYPLAVAVVSLVFPGTGHLMFVGKLVSALSGLTVCWLVYRLLAAMTGHRRVAVLGALLVALDPWQLLYSSNSMTEVPFEVLVFGALERTVARRWTAASVLLVFAGFVRIEAWGLAALVPVAAFLVDRKIKIVPVLLVFVAPAAWLAITYASKGDVRAYFTIRNAYVAEYLAYAPERQHLTMKWAAWDFANLFQGACLPFMVGAAAAGGFLVRSVVRGQRPAGMFGALALAAVYGFLLSFLLAAWVTRSQPVFWVRYGCIYQPLGVCLTLWWLAVGTQWPVRWLAAVVLGWTTLGHIAGESVVVNLMGGNLLYQRQAAALLASLHPNRVFCDSISLRVEADLMPDHACDSSTLRTDPAGFLEDLQKQKIDYLVYIAAEASTPVKLFPELTQFRPAHGLEPFRKFDSSDWRPTVYIYRVTPDAGTAPKTARNGD